MNKDQKDEPVLAEAVLLLCWYLSEGGDFEKTTRRDMVENIVSMISKMDGRNEVLKRAASRLNDRFNSHPLQLQVAAWLEEKKTKKKKKKDNVK